MSSSDGNTSSSTQSLGPYADWGPGVVIAVVSFFNFIAIALHERSLLWPCLSRVFFCLRWNHWPVSYVSNKRDDIPVDTRAKTFWAFDILDPEHLVTSFCFPTWVLLLLHIVCFLYFIAYVLLDVLLYYPEPGLEENPYWQWLTFLTNWSISFYALACFVAAVNTARYMAWKRRVHQQAATQFIASGPAPAVVVTTGHENRLHHPGYNTGLRWKWDWLNIAHQLLMLVFTSAEFFVGVWYWLGVVGIANGDIYENRATTYMPHGGSAVLGVLQIWFTRLPICSHHFPVLLWYGTAYMIFLWIYGSRTGIWRYGLDWHYARPVGAFIILIPIIYITFCIWYFVAKVRFWCCGARLHHPGHAGPVKYPDDDMQLPQPPVSRSHRIDPDDVEAHIHNPRPMAPMATPAPAAPYPAQGAPAPAPYTQPVPYTVIR